MNHFDRTKKLFKMTSFVAAASLSVLTAFAIQPTQASQPTQDRVPPAAASIQEFKPGQLVTVNTLPQHRLADAAASYSFAYISTSPSGEAVVTYGSLSLPQGAQPVGGFPVLAWAPGTSGVAPQCAPSLGEGDYAQPFLNEWVKRGYAVVQTDYSGWGQTTPRPVLHGRSNADAVINAVTAAHSISKQLSNDWIIAGHSEGGGTALWGAGTESATKGPYKLRGAIAYAPTGPGVADFFTYVLNGGEIPQGPQPFIAITALGAKAVDSSINLDNLVAPQMQPQLEATKKACLGDLHEFPQLQPGQYLQKGPDADKLMQYLRAQDPSQLTMNVPVVIYQGGKDETTVTPPTTKKMIGDLNARDAAITYREFPNADHVEVIPAAQDTGEPFTFAADMLHGRPIPNVKQQ